MKFFITIILLSTLLSYGLVNETEIPLFLNIAFVVCIVLIFVLWEYSILNKNYEADFKIRSNRKTFETYGLFFFLSLNVILWLKNDLKNSQFFVYILLAILLIEIGMYFVYKKKKPFTIFIKDNELIIKKRWTQKRNLTELTQIQFNRFNKKLNLDFKSKPEISIKTKDYSDDDIEKLLKILIAKSEHTIIIPPNFEPNLIK